MADSADQTGAQQQQVPQPTDTASLTEKSVSGEVKQQQEPEDPPLSSSISAKEQLPSSADVSSVSEKSPKPRKRSLAVSHQQQAVVSVPEEATTVGGGDGALTGKELGQGQSGHGTDDGDGTASASAVPSYAARTIMNGLKLKLQDQPHPSFCYTYALSPFVDKPVLIDWKVIVNDDIQSQHIRCHALQPGDKVQDLVSSFKRALAKAVVLINTQDNYTLTPEFTEGMMKANYPIVVLTKSDGSSLMELLDKYYEILARLDVEGSAMELQQQEQTEAESSAEGSIPLKKDKPKSDSHGILQRTRALFGMDKKSSSMDLKAEVKRLMFLEREPVSVTTDPGKFTMVMSAFTTYEKQARPDGNHGDVAEVLKKLKSHLSETFPQDFPFYLVLSYRLHMMYSAYDCDEFKTFIPMCISRFEGMDQKNIARVMINFIEKLSQSAYQFLKTKFAAGPQTICARLDHKRLSKQF